MICRFICLRLKRKHQQMGQRRSANAVLEMPPTSPPITWIEIIQPVAKNEAVVVECIAKADNIHEKIKESILIPLTILIIGINVAILFLVVIDKRFYNPKVAFISTLGVADLFVGVVSVGTLITKANEKTYEHCLIRIGFTVTTCVASILSLMCIALERFIAITYSLNYKSVVSKNRVVGAIAAIWIISVVVGFLPLMGWKNNHYQQYCSYLYVLPANYIIFITVFGAIIPLGIMVVIYIKLYRNARFHIKRIEALENIMVVERLRRNMGILRMSARSWRSLKTMIYVFGCVLITWSPFIVASFVQITVGKDMCILKDIVGTHLLVLGFSNSFLNPLIYVLRTKDFQERVKERLERYKVCASYNPNNNNE
ncbi:glucose-dependent insulinotropic receptor-like [Saccostrea echinata]|uniref:glucose-dependent insulinotropic receptor-like n=1 Tax=Saccostrea echinata TaxID=191078 RepID=UPI002A8002ED|nr:glucose-dependent insulinotropic receptor-like [Saccostrea echinata]